MEDIIAATRHVNQLLKASEEYKRFVFARNALCANMDMYQRLKTLKARYTDVQTYWDGNQNDELLHNSVVNEYLRAESALSRLIRRMMDELTADFHIDFE